MTENSSDDPTKPEIGSPEVIDRKRDIDVKTAPIEIIYENQKLYVQCFTCCESADGGILPVELGRLHDKVVEGFNSTPGVFQKERLNLELNGSGPTVSFFDGYISKPEIEQNSERAFTLLPDKVNGLFRIRYNDLRNIISAKSPEYAGISLLWAYPGPNRLAFR